MKISRRALIGGSAAVVGVAAVGGYRIFAPVADPERAIARFIVRQVPDVAADDAVTAMFASDAVAYMRHQFAANFDAHIALLDNALLTRFLPDQQADHQSRFERTLVTLFMRSTDLLLPGRGGGAVNYITFADPYLAGCSNPIAELV